MIAFFEYQLKLDGEEISIAATMFGCPGKTFKNRIAGVRAELAATRAVKQVNGPQKSHVTLADEISHFHPIVANAFGHGQNKSQITAGDFAASIELFLIQLQ
jgi:hypothetical protein